MAKKVTSITLHKTALGDQAAITYSVIGDDGAVTAQNKRAESGVIMDSGVLAAIETLYNFSEGKLPE